MTMAPGGGGAGGIRTLDRPLQAYNGLANRRLQPLGHSSVTRGYARPRREPQAADCRPGRFGEKALPVQPVGAIGVLFVQHLPETLIPKLSAPPLFIACAETFGNSRRRDGGGAPEVVLGGSQEFPRSRGRGEGAKKLSSVPGGHILGGMGEPAQLFWLLSNIASPAHRTSRSSNSESQASDAAASRSGLYGLCPYFRAMRSASAAVDSMKLGGHVSPASLSSRCASFLFFFRSASSPL
jgi:hypothetical protein